MQLSIDQLEAADGGQAVRIVVNGCPYILIREEIYEQQRNAVDEDVSAETVARLIRCTMSDDDDGDPLLDGYQNYGRTS